MQNEQIHEINKIDNTSRRRFLRNAAITGAGVAMLPLLAEPAEAFDLFAAPSAGEQKKVGAEAAKQILKKYPEVHDGRARHFLDIGKKLVAALPNNDRTKWNFEFHVLQSNEVNAFALPGGPMFMFTGLYEKLQSDDAMAAVTGHEMTHVRKEHWAKAYAKQQQQELGITALITILKIGKTGQTFASIVDSALSLKYSRGEEDQADQGGLENMVAAGYNPEGMLQLFEELKKLGGNGGAFGVDWLSDHPLTSDRIKKTQQRITNLQRNRSFPPLTPLHYSALIGG